MSNKIGFHCGPAGNEVGIGEYFLKLDDAGIPFIIKSVDTAGVLWEAQEIARVSDVPHVIIWRRSGVGTPSYDTPNYDLTPKRAADEHWGLHMNAWPQELDPGIVWIETVNEPDKNRSECLADSSIYTAEQALFDGHRYAAFGWSYGEPYIGIDAPNAWNQPKMRDFLRLCARNPDRLAIALHEYSSDVNDISYGYPYHIGRHSFLFTACDIADIERPTTFITEWGWEKGKVPNPAQAMQDVNWAARIYTRYDSIKGVALWYLGGGFDNIADKAQKLIAPITEFSLGFTPTDPPSPPDPTCRGLPRIQYQRTYWVVPAELPEERRVEIYTEAAKKNITVGPSFDDAGIGDLEDKTAVLYGIAPEDRQKYREWYEKWYSDVTVQIVNENESFKLLWPTDEKRVTQVFGDRPEYYAKWGLPGHEGIDLAASEGSQIRACHDGEVYAVQPDDGPYGIHVRIKQIVRDTWGKHKTVYAHLNSASVVVRERVKAGQPIGIAGNTGNSTARHLHLGLQLIGATNSGETEYPHDYIDPAPYLDMEGVVMPGAPYVSWPPGRCLVGLHGRADGRMLESDYEAVRVGRMEAVKLLSSAAPENVDRLLAINPDMFIVVRLFVDLSNRVMTPYEFVHDAINDVGMYYARGVRFFEVHNEPNLYREGFGKSWANGVEFAEWFQLAVDLMKERYPDALFGWPALSPGEDDPGKKYDAKRFLNEAGVTVHSADWIGVHCYFLNDFEMTHEHAGGFWKYYQREYPGKLLLITEFSNPDEDVPKDIKASQYVRYYDWLKNQKPLAAAFCFISSASVGFESETWAGSEIAQIVGARE